MVKMYKINYIKNVTGKLYSPAYLYQLKKKSMLNSNTGEPFAV